jgi:hypothetical protein
MPRHLFAVAHQTDAGVATPGAIGITVQRVPFQLRALLPKSQSAAAQKRAETHEISPSVSPQETLAPGPPSSAKATDQLAPLQMPMMTRVCPSA